LGWKLSFAFLLAIVAWAAVGITTTILLTLSCRCCSRPIISSRFDWVNQRVKGRSYSRRLSIEITNFAPDYLIHSSFSFLFFAVALISSGYTRL
jgi:hypothetical protein